jgi:hypothetical protein
MDGSGRGAARPIFLSLSGWVLCSPRRLFPFANISKYNVPKNQKYSAKYSRSRTRPLPANNNSQQKLEIESKSEREHEGKKITRQTLPHRIVAKNSRAADSCAGHARYADHWRRGCQRSSTCRPLHCGFARRTKCGERDEVLRCGSLGYWFVGLGTGDFVRAD